MSASRNIFQEERFEDWMAMEADDIALSWFHEYQTTGFIEALGYDKAELDYLAEQTGRSVMEILADESMANVRANPEAYLPEPDYY